MTGRAWVFATWGLLPTLLGGMVAVAIAAGVPLSRDVDDKSGARLVRSAVPLFRRSVDTDLTVPARALFRITRVPAPVPFDPRGEAPEIPPAEPKPMLVLVGVVLGPARAALVRGIPGLDGVQVITEGEEIGGVRVVRVEAAEAVLQWRADTIRVVLPRETT